MVPKSIDRIHRVPRLWSNTELRKYAGFFGGDIVNVSGWTDVDKEGGYYRDYFTNAESYTITNFRADMRGFQGAEGEIFLDLEDELSNEMRGAYDVVFNHTTLEHVYEARKAFANLCSLSRDAVIIVLPFLQQYHADYGDFWRFSPLAIKRLFEENNFDLIYQSFNTDKGCSVYTFSIATKNPLKWKEKFDWRFTVEDPIATGPEPYIGCNAIKNSVFRDLSIKKIIKSLFRRINVYLKKCD